MQTVAAASRRHSYSSSEASGSAGGRKRHGNRQGKGGAGWFSAKPAAASLRKHTTTRPGSGRASNCPSATEGWWRRCRRPPAPRGPAGAPEPRQRREPPQRSDLPTPSATSCAEPTCASIPQSALAAAITEGGSWAGEGGRQVHASQTDHPEHESAASTTRVATSATPSADELRRTNLRKRATVSPGGSNQGGRERG